MVASCQAAIGSHCCAGASEPPASSRWVAIVSFGDDLATTATIEFRPADEPERLLGTRTIAFSRTDPLRLRCASLGLVVAAFVVAQSSAEAPASPSPAEPEVPIPPPIRDPVAPPRHPWGVDGAATAGFTGLPGSWRLGGFLRGWRALPLESHLVAVTLGAGLRYAEAWSGSLSAEWWGASVGAELRVGPSSSAISAELQADAVVERVVLQTSAGPGVTPPSDREWEVGARMAAQTVLRWSSSLSGFLGCELIATRPRLVVELDGVPVGTEPVLGGSLFLGLRLAP